MTQSSTQSGLVRMDGTETGRSTSRVRIEPAAGFLSQLIAERERLPAQRARRRAPVGIAIAAYDQGERRDARRLPQGFFRTTEA